MPKTGLISNKSAANRKWDGLLAAYLMSIRVAALIQPAARALVERARVILRDFASGKGVAAASFGAKRLNGVDVCSAGGRHQRRHDR